MTYLVQDHSADLTEADPIIDPILARGILNVYRLVHKLTDAKGDFVVALAAYDNVPPGKLDKEDPHRFMGEFSRDENVQILVDDCRTLNGKILQQRERSQHCID